jgi:hypothetical protein
METDSEERKQDGDKVAGNEGQGFSRANKTVLCSSVSGMSYQGVVGDEKCCDTVTDVEKVDEIKYGQDNKEGEKEDREAEKMEERKDDEAGVVEGIEIEVAMEVEGTAAMEVGRTAVVSADDRGARDELCQQSDLFLSDQSVSIFLSEQSVSMSLF